jgi:chromosomal replication initiation ATPase DnaA
MFRRSRAISVRHFIGFLPLTRQTAKARAPSDQGHLDFGAPDFAPGNYVKSPQNARARAALETWATWPGGVFCLFGEAGAGKSHLGHMWASAASAPILRGQDFDLTALAKLTTHVALIDDADTCDETALFGLLTSLEHAGGAVLLIARTPPSLWPFSLPDLKSRLNAIACETLIPPEPELLAQLIIRLSAARGFKIDEASSIYLANRIPRRFAACRAIASCMESVSRASLKSPMALAQQALQALYKSDGYDDEPTNDDLFGL